MDKKYVLRIISAASPNLYLAIRRRHERKGQKDSRRKAIASQFPLTKEQKEQIDDFYVSNYGERIGYSWHQNYAAHSGKFDYRYFPELLFTPEFEMFQNQRGGVVAAFSDKNLLPIAAKVAGVKMPRTIVSCTNGVLRDCENSVITPGMAAEIVKRNGRCFLKPSVDSRSGQGCTIIKEDDNIIFLHNQLNINNVINGGTKMTLLSRNLSFVMRASVQSIRTA